MLSLQASTAGNIIHCGVVGGSLSYKQRATRTEDYLCVGRINYRMYAGATYVEWDHERGTFGVWSREELPAAAAAASGTLRGLQRDHTSGAELPIGKAAILAWAHAERGATEPSSDSELVACWQQRLATLQVRARCPLDCDITHVRWFGGLF